MIDDMLDRIFEPIIRIVLWTAAIAFVMGFGVEFYFGN